MAAAPDGGFHAAGGDRCRCIHVAVSVRLSSGAWRGCRSARRAIARSTGMQERGQREAVPVTVIQRVRKRAAQHAFLRCPKMNWRESRAEFAACAKKRIA
ncbi:hypothetical protein DIE03_02245 [Burkholderia sp. Bp8992]|nr:hypothetical protein DIE03_02245 [Burkholderia sp. Bp8992]